MTDTTSDKITDSTREAWLERAIDMFRPRFVEVGYPLPDKIHVSIGFGYGARAESKYILGQMWIKAASADNVNHLFIGPMEGDPAEILVTLLHELIHVADDGASGHKGAFAEMATRLGFEGPMTQTPPTAGLLAELVVMAAELGNFPHAKLEVDAGKVVPVPVPLPDGTTPKPVKIHTGPSKQGTRMLKVVCPDVRCPLAVPATDKRPAQPYLVRMTRTWLDVGAPTCPAGHEMVEAA
jgi:hypothetical protein